MSDMLGASCIHGKDATLCDECFKPVMLTIEYNEKSWAPDVAGALMDPDGNVVFTHISSSKEWLLQDLTKNFGREKLLGDQYPVGIEIVWKEVEY